VKTSALRLLSNIENNGGIEGKLKILINDENVGMAKYHRKAKKMKSIMAKWRRKYGQRRRMAAGISSIVAASASSAIGESRKAKMKA
jgi:hypothetical protein